jgi:hypothetical protein
LNYPARLDPLTTRQKSSILPKSHSPCPHTTKSNTKAADHANALSPGLPQAQCSTIIALVTNPRHDINFFWQTILK